MKQFTLKNPGTLTKSFTFHWSFSYINIKKIIINSLLEKDSKEWTKELHQCYLSFELTDGFGSAKSFPLDIDSQISPYHVRPIIVFENFIVPEENKGKMTSTKNYYKNLIIRLANNSTSENVPLEMTIYYESTPGVIENEN